MGAPRVERRLAAILSADVAGYSRLMERDEAGTVARLKTLRAELIEPILAEQGGRFVDLKGDGAVVEFTSVTAAVEAAVAIQRAMAAHEADRPEAERIRYRIGINLGDVVVDGRDIYGDGVNVAARIQALCEPGGVWVTARVYDAVRGKIDVPFAPTGRHRVKNIAEPIEAFRACPEGGPVRRRALSFQLHRWMVAAAAAMLLILVGTGAAWHFWPDEKRAGKPAIAVLPFENYGGDKATGRLADGITEDIVTDLARFHDLDVIARNSTEVYKGKAVDVREIGKELAVGYVLEGSIQRQRDQVRVTAQLIDASAGTHVWSDRWDRPARDVFAVQTEVAEEVAAALGGDLTMGQIARSEVQRAKRLQPSDLKAYDYFLLGKEAKSAVTRDSVFRGLELLNRAIELDPNLARAYSVRAWLHNFSIMFGVDGATAIAHMMRDAEKAVELDPRDAESLATLGIARIFQGRYEEADTLLRSAVDLSPANSHVLILAAGGSAFIGKPDEAARFADRALRLDPRMTPANITGVKDAYYMARRYDDTIAAVNRMPEESRTRDAWLFLAASYAHLGRSGEAAKAKAKLLDRFPNVSAERMLNEDYAFARREDEDFFVETFRILDLPVCLRPEETARMPGPKARAECEAERARVAATRS